MKKIKTMRIASILLIAVLMTTCAISGTFAKYVTENGSSDSARVAKWGVTIEADYSELFTNTYATYETWDGDDGFSVEGAASGTNGTLADFEVNGTPEVDVVVTYTPNLTLANWTVDDGVYYCPITITVNGTDYYGLSYNSASDFEAAVEGAITAATQKYDALTDLSGETVAGDLNVTWSWAIEGTDGNQTNVKDTALGDAATAATIELTINCTITQID